MVRATASLVAIFALISAPFVMIEGCGSRPFDIPCDPAIGCGGGYICWEGPNNQNDCLPPCKTTADCPTKDSYGNPVSLTCIKGNCYRPEFPPDTNTNDAGDCGEGGGGGDGGKMSAICGDTCTPYPDGWSSAQAVWHGPVDDAPTFTDVPLELGGPNTWPIITGYADVHADPAICDACKCGDATGKCTELPTSISIHAAKCGEVGADIEFAGPANWDGSCTDTYALGAGKTCPAGSSTLCAQSVAVSALGLPVEESCAPMIDALPVLRIGINPPSWKTEAVGYKVPGCEDRGSCMPQIDGLPSGYRSCIYQHGEHECPAQWSGERFVVYERTADKPGWIDGRECTACACGTPIGSACAGHFRTFEDGACTKLLSDDQVFSLGEQCTNYFPPGPAVGSKEITGLTYIPGFCEVTGGEPIGDVKADPAQAVTFCCNAATI